VQYLCLVYAENAELASEDGVDATGDAVTVRVRGGTLLVRDVEDATREPLVGFRLIEARDLNEAIQLASRIPPAQVGAVEVRPIRPIRETVRAMEKEGASDGVR
jgi:hypothetical protein